MSKNSKKNDTKNKITVEEENLNAGIALINRHPLFSRLNGYKKYEAGNNWGETVPLW